MTQQILVADKTAAAMLDLKPSQFADLVASGALPAPVKFAGGIDRWRVAELQAIASGKAADRPLEW
jgi:predicted DNA-binding transcriptional regulator AlpA